MATEETKKPYMYKLHLETACGCKRIINSPHVPPSYDLPIAQLTKTWELDDATIYSDDRMVRRFERQGGNGNEILYREVGLAQFSEVDRDPSFINKAKEQAKIETLKKCILHACPLCRLFHRVEEDGPDNWFHPLDYPEGVEQRPCSATLIRRELRKAEEK